MKIISLARSPKQLLNILKFLNQKHKDINDNLLIIIDNFRKSKYQNIQIKNIIANNKIKCQLIERSNRYASVKIFFYYLINFFSKKYISCIGDPRIIDSNKILKYIFYDKASKVNIFDDGLVSVRYSGKFSKKVFFFTSYFELFTQKKNVYNFYIYTKINTKPKKKLIIIGQNIYNKNIYSKNEYLKIINTIIFFFNKEYIYIPHRNEDYSFLINNKINAIEPNEDINDLFFTNPQLIGDTVFSIYSSALIDLRIMFTNKKINFYFYYSKKLENIHQVSEIHYFYKKLNFIKVNDLLSENIKEILQK